jgi:hypothetical protein
MADLYSIIETLIVIALLVICLKRRSLGMSNRVLTIAVWAMFIGRVLPLAELFIGENDLMFYSEKLLGESTDHDPSDFTLANFITRYQLVTYGFAFLSAVGYFLFALGIFILSKRAIIETSNPAMNSPSP